MTDEDCKPCTQALHEILNSQLGAAADDTTIFKYANFFQGLEPYLVDARPFRTASGLAGQGMCSICSNDRTAVVAGVPSPVALRPVVGRGDKCFWNVGPCYVHGIMHVEAVMEEFRQRWDRCEPENIFEEIHIV